MSDVFDLDPFIEADEEDPYLEMNNLPYLDEVPEVPDDDQSGSSSDGSDDNGDVQLPYEEEHPNKYVPWGMKGYECDVIESWTMVHNSALTGHHQAASEYMEKLSKEVLDQPNHEGETLLYMAAFRGHTQMVANLLKAGADPNKGDEYFDMSPLFGAVQNCHIECVNKLLEYVPVDYVNKSGFTALFKAAQFGPHKDMLRYMTPPPHLDEILRVARPQNEAILDILLDRGADVNFTSTVGLTPLLVATREDNVYAVRRLLDLGANPMALYKHPMSSMKEPLSALDIAAEDESTESLKLILEKCGDNKALTSRNNAMCLAVRKGNLDCVKALMDAGFDADMGVKLPDKELEEFRSSYDALPMLTCIDKVNVELARYLLSKGASPLYRNRPLAIPLDRCPIYNAFLKSSELLDILLTHCAEMKTCPTLRNFYFPTAELAVWQQAPECFELVLRAGFKIRFDTIDFENLEDLHQITFEEVAKIWWTYSDKHPTDEHVTDALGYLVETPHSLADLCRVAIRRSIGFPKLAKPSASVSLLPIPQHLQEYVGHL